VEPFVCVPHLILKKAFLSSTEKNDHLRQEPDEREREERWERRGEERRGGGV
jgi:hypothetical protein